MPGIGVAVTVDGVRHDDEVEACLPLTHYLHDRVSGGLPLGCEAAECGGCIVLVDGVAVKSCLMLAVQADGCEVTTVRGLADDDAVRCLARTFRRYVRRCAQCLPGLTVAAVDLLRDQEAVLSEQEIRARLAGVRCPCGDEADVVRAVREAADVLEALGTRTAG
ncbi:(2Fe-2S)-binding protein [Thermobifida cellulosilytica]|uniref:Carbon monoxide dehydrogenase n=1 Tax=Thermobifida cellulosilytica TB100 TaxID=665004 RepID=A0A147KKQ2_THECS|nr:2Fe-2S iron-sulfur cluster-binding protein [Thermobifida cellulosilytica]KUP97905.1 carbon monoxide dehydrogenase [Thermobifida cellulosilytica TB100]